MEVISNLTKEINRISLKLDVDTFISKDERQHLEEQIKDLVEKRSRARGILEPLFSEE